MQTVSTTDLALVRRTLTASYTVTEGKQANSIRCTSRIGMRLANDDDDDATFDRAMAVLGEHFGARLLEVDHNVCAYHSDFMIYLRGAAPTL